MRAKSLLLMLTVAAPAAHAKGLPESYAKFAEGRRNFCMGAKGELDEPVAVEVAGHKYRLEGHRLVQLDRDDDHRLRIGVISATKDDRDETLAAIEALYAGMKKLGGIDVLVVNGDLATHEINPDEALFPKLAGLGVLTVVTVGNTESCGLFNEAATKTFASANHFINGNWVRQIELDDGVLYTLPGYHDRRFTHSGGAEKYSDQDLLDLKRMIRDGPGPKILVAHGPPRMKGRFGIDIITGGDHVGDPKMTELIELAGVRVGIFGHILESGGRASNLDGTGKAKERQWAKTLFVNAGTANPDPWPLLDGKTSYGMGLVVHVEPARARHQVIRLPEQAE